MKNLAGLLSLALLLAQWGCASSKVKDLPEPPSEAIRSTFGRIGVTWTNGNPSDHLAIHPVGPCSGTGRGAVAGLLTDAEVTFYLFGGACVAEPVGPLLGAAFLAAGLAFTPVAALFGSLWGAGASPSDRQVEAAHQTLRRAAEEAALPRRIAEAIVEAGRERTDEALALLEPGSSREGFDTIVEIDAPKLLLQGGISVDPPLKFLTVVSARVIPSSEGRDLYSGELARQAAAAVTLLRWAENDGAEFRSALEQVPLQCADRFVEEMFLLYPLPTGQPWETRR